MAKSPKKDKKITAPELPKNYFKPKELACKCGCGTNEFDPDFQVTLNAIREECGFALPLSSAYRCPLHPIEARKEVAGAHTTGKACDVLCSAEKALEVIRVALKHGIKRIGVQQKGGGRFIHLDGCTQEEGFPSPALWSY
jgi:zinc D-Ala-D-Ala carboxypeptidase